MSEPPDTPIPYPCRTGLIPALTCTFTVACSSLCVSMSHLWRGIAPITTHKRGNVVLCARLGYPTATLFPLTFSFTRPMIGTVVSSAAALLAWKEARGFSPAPLRSSARGKGRSLAGLPLKPRRPAGVKDPVGTLWDDGAGEGRSMRPSPQILQGFSPEESSRSNVDRRDRPRSVRLPEDRQGRSRPG